MRFCEKMLTVHISTIMRPNMRNLVKIGLLDFAVVRVRTSPSVPDLGGRCRPGTHTWRLSLHQQFCLPILRKTDLQGNSFHHLIGREDDS